MLTSALLGPQAGISASGSLAGAAVAGGTALAGYGFWRRFRLPIAVPVTLMSAMAIGDHLMIAASPGAGPTLVTAYLALVALAVLAAAMWWDASDVYRQTIRSDVGFWLHALAGFEIATVGLRLSLGTVGPVVGWASLWAPPALIGPSAALLFLALVPLFAGLALVSDRRAVLVASMVFVLRAIQAVLGDSPGLPLLLTGVLLVALTLKWKRLRRALLTRLPPPVRAQLPRGEPEFWYPRPIT